MAHGITWKLEVNLAAERCAPLVLTSGSQGL